MTIFSYYESNIITMLSDKYNALIYGDYILT